MIVRRGYCGTGGKPTGNSEHKHDPNQSEEPIYSTDAPESVFTFSQNMHLGVPKPISAQQVRGLRGNPVVRLVPLCR